ILAPKVFFSDISNKKYKTYMIMELLGSKTLKDLNNVDSYLETFGKLCTTFHNIESKVQGRIVNDKIVPISIKEINETSFKTNLNKLVEKNCFTKIEMDTILEVHNTYFDSSKAVLCHMDLALSNVLIDKSDSILGIIDWEWAGYYPPEFELAKIELFFAIDKLDFNKFLKGYREISPVRNYEKMRKSFILTHLLQLLNLFKNITFEEDKYKIYKKYLDNFLFSN
ncbi:MAG: phosphotransferase, partial [Nanoarchaeales archaeon]|nr:phosphotransferase [Nanoarchaeales archaeon]